MSKEINLETEEIRDRISNYGTFEIFQNGDAKTRYVVVEPLNTYGVHCRPATLIVKAAEKYDSEICFYDPSGTKIPALSIMGLMTAKMGKGEKRLLVARGKDAKESLEDIVGLFKDKFNEVGEN